MSEIEVTAADREAAWPFRERKSDGPSKEKWLSGFYDEIPIIRAFAANRLAAEQASDKLAAEWLRINPHGFSKDPVRHRIADAILRGKHRRK